MAVDHPTRPKHWTWSFALVAVTLLALGLRWYYVSTAIVYHPLRGDAIQYHAYAWNLAHHGIFARSASDATVLIPDDYRDPGYPLLLAAWMKLLGDGEAWYAAVLLCQALLGALTVTMATQLGRHWLPAKWAIGAGILMAIWPHSIAIPSFLLTETLFGFLCALAMLLCARACDRGSAGWAVAAGLAFGAAALTNAVLLPFGILLALFLAWRKLASRRVWVALALGALVLPGIWTVRNSQLPSQATISSSTDRALQNLVQGSWPAYHAAYIAMAKGDPRGKQILHAIGDEYHLLRTSPAKGTQAMLHRLSEHPWHYLGWYLFEKPRLLWGWSIRVGQGDIYVYPTLNSPFVTQPVMRALESICQTLNPWLALMALISAVSVLTSALRSGADRKHNAEAMLQAVILLVGFVTFVYCTLQSEPRYSIPFRAFEMLLVASTAYWLHSWVSSLRQNHLALASTAAVNPTLVPPASDRQRM